MHLHAFVECKNVLAADELNTQPFNLNQNCIIHELNEQIRRIFWLWKLFISEDNLQLEITNLFDLFDVSIEEILLSQSELETRIAQLEYDLEKRSWKEFRIYYLRFSIEIIENVEIETLFNIKYARKMHKNEEEILEYSRLWFPVI